MAHVNFDAEFFSVVGDNDPTKHVSSSIVPIEAVFN